jgi:hypothetical protein
MMLSAGKDPLGGVMWGPNVERFDHLLHALAASSDVPVADLPWTSAERVEADNACRLAAVLDGPPLLPGDGAAQSVVRPLENGGHFGHFERLRRFGPMVHCPYI